MPEEFMDMWENESFTYEWFAAFVKQPYYPPRHHRLKLYDLLATYCAMSV